MKKENTLESLLRVETALFEGKEDNGSNENCSKSSCSSASAHDENFVDDDDVVVVVVCVVVSVDGGVYMNSSSLSSRSNYRTLVSNNHFSIQINTYRIKKYFRFHLYLINLNVIDLTKLTKILQHPLINIIFF